MKNKKIIIFCESYPSIAYTLYKIDQEKNNLLNLIIFIPALKDLYTFFQEINNKLFDNKINILYFQNNNIKWKEINGLWNRIIFSIITIIKKRLQLKNYYKKHFSHISSSEIHFTSRGFSEAKIYMLYRLKRKNSLFFVDPGGPNKMKEQRIKTPKELFILIYNKLLIGRQTKIGQYPPYTPDLSCFPILPDNFMKNSVDGIIEWFNRKKIMDVFPWNNYRIFNTGKAKVLYFHQDLVNRYVPDRDLFASELNKIFNIILSFYAEDEIYIKHHPGHESNKDILTVGKELPVYIPSELFKCDQIQIFLGISSSALGNIRFKGKSISIVNLITWNSEELKVHQREWLIDMSQREIYFPESLKDFQNKLSEILR